MLSTDQAPVAPRLGEKLGVSLDLMTFIFPLGGGTGGKEEARFHQ